MLSIPVAVVVAMEIKHSLHMRKVDRGIDRAVRLREAEQLIKHVKSMTAPSLDVAIPQAKQRRGRPSKAVAV